MYKITLNSRQIIECDNYKIARSFVKLKNAKYVKKHLKEKPCRCDKPFGSPCVNRHGFFTTEYRQPVGDVILNYRIVKEIKEEVK